MKSQDKNLYTFKVYKNGKEVTTIHTKKTKDEIIANEIWEKMQSHYESRWGLFGYNYRIIMLKNGKSIHSIDYEC